MYNCSGGVNSRALVVAIVKLIEVGVAEVATLEGPGSEA